VPSRPKQKKCSEAENQVNGDLFIRADMIRSVSVIRFDGGKIPTQLGAVGPVIETDSFQRSQLTKGTDPVFEALRLKELKTVGSAESNSPIYGNMPSSSSPRGVCLSSQAWLS
jgi:hypothetical protein